MPRINDGLDQHKLPTGSYGYSAIGLDKLLATEYTLCTIIQDASGSVSSYRKEMESAIKEIIKACQQSPRADNLLLRIVLFSDDVEEIHGFKLLSQCNLSDYDNCIKIKGMTALYDAAENAIAATGDYAKQLSGSDFSANAIVFINTDGCDNQSALGPDSVKKTLMKIVKSEYLESIITVLVGVGTGYDPDIGKQLSKFATEAQLTQYVELKDATAKTLAKLAAFVSKSISAQSNAIGTGSAASSTQIPNIII
jgi:uncharacterized protein YegL